MSLRDFSQQYLNILKTDLGGLNLTRILETDEFYNKQILDSVLPFQQSKLLNSHLLKNPVILDVGFGGGFPLLPLAFSYPDLNFVGIESREKKVKAVSFLAEKLNIKNSKTIHLRIENLLINIPAIITFKAVGKVSDYLPLLNLSNREVLVAFYKGPSFLTDELDPFKEKLVDSWDLVENIDVEIPETNKRSLIVFKQKNVPRGTDIKNLVNLSDII